MRLLDFPGFLECLDRETKIRPELVALTCGCLIGVTYFIVSLQQIVSEVLFFSIGSFVSSMFLIVTGKSRFLSSLGSFALWWRGIIFAATQILICQSISGGSAFSSLGASMVGTIFGLTIGRFYFRELTTLRQSIGIIFAFIGAAVLLESGNVTIGAVVSGLLLGLNSALTRSILVEDKFGTITVIATPLLLASLFMMAFSFFINDSLDLTSINLNQLLLFSGALLLVQVMTCIVLRHCSVQMTSVLTLVRLPVSMSMEYLFLGKNVSVGSFSAICSILIGAAFFLMQKSRGSRHST